MFSPACGWLVYLLCRFHWGIWLELSTSISSCCGNLWPNLSPAMLLVWIRLCSGSFTDRPCKTQHTNVVRQRFLLSEHKNIMVMIVIRYSFCSCSFLVKLAILYVKVPYAAWWIVIWEVSFWLILVVDNKWKKVFKRHYWLPCKS